VTEYKSINVKPETYTELTSIGKKGESYDDIIRRLIHDYKVYVVD
jgi:predicted CopG family antitoxin